ncbi:integrase [Bosea sp. OAE752]|uniref:tyrosine-type recombinase/integrase n=1 Tax=Bosea sp. OAE752 TaxID=2663873 RepID=UPI003D1A0B6E
MNAARGIEVIARRDQGSKKVTPPTKAELSKLLTKADEDFKIAVLFAAASGLWAGALGALRWRHIDFAGQEITVETRVDQFKEEDTTKPEAGIREVPIGAGMTLKAWRLRSKFSKADDLVFPNRRGGFMNHDNRMHRTFRPLRLKAEVAGLKWHALRHFAISTWITSSS